MERRFQLLDGAVQICLQQGAEPEEIVPVLLDALELARANHRASLLVISGLGDPATPQSVSGAIERIHAAGAPAAFRIAFVAYTFPQYSVYHFVERYAQKFGILAKVVVSVRDAKDWLGLPEDGESARWAGYGRAQAPSGAAGPAAGDRPRA